MTTFHPPFSAPHVVRADSSAPNSSPLVVLFHGRGADAGDIIGLALSLPRRFEYAAVRAPIAEGGGYAWFANRGIGRPIAESLRDTMDWFVEWLDGEAGDRPVILIGFSGGGAFAGGLLLDRPSSYRGAAILNATLPFDAGVPTSPGRLDGVPVFLSHGIDDTVIPVELQARTWDYLTGPSQALVAARREAAGHELTASAVAALAEWLEALA